MSEPAVQRPAPRALPPISFPEELPVSARRDEIARAIAAHPVVIVSGETGSGKTTQLPKICLALGRGRKRLIGHTQPRRIAAASVARRIAHELGTPPGEVVGFKVRFGDHTRPGASIKLMTDGILLAETQSDPQLAAYDTILIDEAHERSLNIDFLLGYLKQLLPRRPDLKLIVTSATLDAERFAQHFGAQGSPAPVIAVSGRTYPVQIRWRPLRDADDADDRTLMDGIVDAVDECARAGRGDVLVFLPGEREIREAAEALRKHHPPGTELLPLYARLSAEEQDRVFNSGESGSMRRRIVLATNVAETSLTVPGIRYVVDTGVARVKRYSYRNKVEQLQVEPISQASASQRAGRCGRVSEGICIRLYDEADFAQRPRFTDPEILRASLAGVILRMKSLGLGEVRAFPFVEPPPGRAIADGYDLLAELGAVDEDNELTPLGRELARLPLDPRVGRMLLAAREQHALAEVLIIAAALSVQDPRQRPGEQLQAADQAHRRFADDGSDFLSLVKLWQFVHEAIEHKKSNRKLTADLHAHFISPRRVREWQDVHSQLAQQVAQLGWRVNASPATFEQVHLSLLAGLLGNVGVKTLDAGASGQRGEPPYVGARGIKFHVWPGSPLAKKAGRWLMAAELIETSRLFARCVATLDPAWIERVGAHLLKKSWSQPHWEKGAGQVIAFERAALYGMTVYAQRRVPFGARDPQAARELFIRAALVDGEFDTQAPFFQHNRRLVREIRELEHKTRRPDVLVDEELIFRFYDRLVPAEVCSGAQFDAWRREAEKSDPKLLLLSRDELMRHEAAGATTDFFPKQWSLGGVEMALAYHFEPGSARDGVTLAVPIYALNQVDPLRCDWLVPGMLKEKAHLALKSLPQKLRRHCVPLPEYAAGFVARHAEMLAAPRVPLVDALIDDLRQCKSVACQSGDFKLEQLPAHLTMNFKVIDEHGRQLGMGRSLAQLRAEFGGQAQRSFQTLAARDAQVADQLHEAIVDWDFGALPELLEVRRGGQTLTGYPALVDHDTHCEVEVFDSPEQAQSRHRDGLRRLFRLQLKENLKFIERQLASLQTVQMQASTVPALAQALPSFEVLKQQVLTAAIDRVCLADRWPADDAGFAARRLEAKGRLGLIAQELARLATAIVHEAAPLPKKLAGRRAFAAAVADVEQQLRQLFAPGFLVATPAAQLAHYPRYLKAIAARLDKLAGDPARDAQRQAELAQLSVAFQRELTARKGVADPRLAEFRWLLEELRVSLFAQELRTPVPVSVKRLHKVWQSLRR